MILKYFFFIWSYFYCSEWSYMSSGKSLRAARSSLFFWDNRLLMWVRLNNCYVCIFYWVYFVSSWQYLHSGCLSLHKIYFLAMSVFYFIFCFVFPHQEGKDKSYLLDKLQNLQTSQPNKTNKQTNQKKVCCENCLILIYRLSSFTLSLPSHSFFSCPPAHQRVLRCPLFKQSVQLKRCGSGFTRSAAARRTRRKTQHWWSPRSHLHLHLQRPDAGHVGSSKSWRPWWRFVPDAW